MKNFVSPRSQVISSLYVSFIFHAFHATSKGAQKTATIRYIRFNRQF